MEVHSGILTVKVSSILKNKLYSNFWCILYNGRSSLSPRIDLYEDISHVDNISCKKTIYIENAKWKKVEPSGPFFSFVVKHNKEYIFVAASTSELKLWILILCCVSKDLSGTRHFVLGIEDLGKMNSNNTNDDEEEVVMQDNFVYSSSNELSTFNVVADKSEECLKNGLKGLYKMKIGQGNVQLLEHDTEKVVACWSLTFLKKFGYSPNAVFIETGSRTVTGAGKFSFHTTEGKIINERLNLEARLLQAQSHKSEDNYLTKAATVMAGSFTPVDIVKSKPPVPPTKPKSLRSRNSGNEPFKLVHEEPKCVNDDQLSKKHTPAFGIPVFLSVTSQTSNLRVSDIASLPADYEICKGKGLNGLDHTDNSLVEIGEKKQMLARSVSSQSSESENKKYGKKAQKEMKKEKKKKEEEEKKEKKRREEEKKKEQKRKEEEEKKIRKELKKSKQKVGKTSSVSSQSGISKVNCDYSEPDALQDTYSEISIEADSAKSHSVADNSYSEKIYSEPWGALPLIPMLPVGDSTTVEYAQPEKTSVRKVASFEPRDVVHTENYADCQVDESNYVTPVLIPAKWEEEDDSNTGLYAHLNENRSSFTQQESVYGIASASHTVHVSEDENPYEDTSLPT